MIYLLVTYMRGEVLGVFDSLEKAEKARVDNSNRILEYKLNGGRIKAYNVIVDGKIESVVWGYDVRVEEEK